MSRSIWRTLMTLVVVAAASLVAACGSGGDGGGNGGSGGGSEPAGGGGDVTAELFAGSAADNVDDPPEGERGGTITMLSAADVDFMDPGKTYYSYAFGIVSSVHRQLYSSEPSGEVVPDIAEEEPEISDDERTVTIRLREGVVFSEPVNREVTSADIKYAIERGFTENVQNGYVTSYINDVVGAPEELGEFQEIEGIETPDDRTIVFRLEEGLVAQLVGALSMPISSPVPQEYAQEFDAETPSTYGEGHAVYTGPYMVRSDAEGRAVGYQPQRRIQLVRNPQYSDVGDHRPAYADGWDIRAGNEDDNAATRRILNSESLVSGDFRPPSDQLESLLQSNKENLSAVPSGGWRMISMDTSRPPFDDVNVRKAVIAGFDRNAARQQRGGEAIGPIAQHYLPPGIAGFEESGGVEGNPEFDWMQNPAGDAELSAEYFRAAGMSSGRYEGNAEVLIVGDNGSPDNAIAQITEQQLQEMGFRTQLRLVARNTMFTRFCNVPDADVNVCPSVGWLRDFDDPQTMLDKTFNGNTILPANNTNWPELDVPEINEAIAQARGVTEEGERAQAWADVNDMVVAQAPAIPYMWDYQTLVKSPNVQGVQSRYSTLWDLNYTSIQP